jgi:leucyl aminopeptidase
MMKIVVAEKRVEEVVSDIEIVFVIEKDFGHPFVTDKEQLEFVGFKGEEGQSAIIGKKLYVAIESFEHDELRTAAATAIKTIGQKPITSAKVALYIQEGDAATTYIRAMVDGFILGGYSFDEYKSKKSESKFDLITIVSESYNDELCDTMELQSAVNKARITSNAVNLTRDIVNTIPNDFTPIAMANKAEEIAKENGLECRIEDEQFMAENGMNAMLAVARASVHKPRLIHLTHRPKNPKGKIVLVGKGLTYDSGGLSLKPGDYMVTMKADKSGGSAVLGIMDAVSRLKLPYEVHGIVGAVENMIGGDAYKPDDVLVAKNGKTIEVRNTDAEGRLVLADVLTYAQEEVDADYILDFATLTGACVVALGEYTTGIMGHSNKIKHQLFQAANDSGELVGSLPFNKYLKKLLKSEIADISNISSSRYGGAITAGLFLDNFIEEKNKDKWMHLDIAGPAYVEKAWGYNPYGASGAGVRLALKFIEQLETL